MNNQPSNTDKQQADQHVNEQPRAVVPKRDRHHHVGTAHRTQGANQQEKWPSRVEAGSAILLVLITGFYTYYASRQANLTRAAVDAANTQAQLMREALNESRSQSTEIHRSVQAAVDSAEASKQSASATMKQADASVGALKQAETANRLTERLIQNSVTATEHDQRALVQLTGFRIEKEPVPNKTPGNETLTVIYNFVNIGKTPATAMAVKDFALILPASLSRELPQPEWGPFNPLDSMVLFPMTTAPPIPHQTSRTITVTSGTTESWFIETKRSRG
jgi:hypothetical protein